MKVKLLTLVTGDEYHDVELLPVTNSGIPKEMDAMVRLVIDQNQKEIFINVNMIVSVEPYSVFNRWVHAKEVKANEKQGK